MGDIVITPASNDVNSTAGTLVLRSSDLNPISLRTNDTNRLFIDPTGSVGLGTAVPTGGLHINYAPGAFSEALRLQRNGGIFYSFGLDTNFLNIAYNGNVNANNVLVLTSNGYLGVGNLQNALFNLDVASTQGKGIQLRYDASTGYRAQIIPYWNTNTDTRIDFAINRVQNVASTVIMSVGYDNNVGIGTTQPTYKLDVAGAIGMHDEAQDIDSRFYGATFLRGWQSFSGGSEANITYTTDGTSPVGVEVLSVSSYVWARGPKIRLDKTQNYEIELWVKRQTANIAGDFYVVVSNYDNGGNVISGDGTDWHYPIAVNPLSASWTKYRFIVGPYGGSKDHSPNARYISVGFIANYTTGTDVIYITGFKCRPIPRYNNDNLTLFNDGRVGIGTTQPTGVLHLYGNTNSWQTSPSIVMASSSTLNANIRNWRIGPADTNYGNFHIGVSDVRGGTVDSNAEAQAFTITYDQKVGIGRIDPPDKLSVHNGNISLSDSYKLYNGSANDSVGLFFSAALQANISAYNGIIFRSSPTNIASQTERMRITSGGNVGVGTNTPYSLLDVQLASASQRYLTLSTNDGQGSLNGFGLNFRIANTDHDIAQIRGDYESSAGGGYGGLFFATRFSGTLYNRVAFNDNGRVGIGVSYATTLLSIGGAGSTTAASGITFGGNAQANLYRVGEDSIKTDGNLYVAGNTILQGDKYLTTLKSVFLVARGAGLNNNASRYLAINNTAIYNNTSRGLRLTIINATNLAVVSNTDYDTVGSDAACDDLATAINGMTSQQIGVLTSYDAWERDRASLRTAALNVGLTKLGTYSTGAAIRKPYAAIFNGTSDTANATTKHVIERMESSDADATRALITTYLTTDGTYASIDAALHMPNALYASDADIEYPIVAVNSVGNVGIGTTAAGTKLEVYGVLRVTESSSGGILQLSAGASNVDIASTFYGGSRRPITFTVDSERMRIEANGRVGIGTNSALAQLHVTGQTYLTNVVASVARNQLTINTNGANYAHFYDVGVSANNALAIGGNGAITTVPTKAIMSWRLSTENVGIGLTNPEATSALHIKNLDAAAKVTIESADASQAYVNFSAQSSEYSVGFVRDGSNVNSLRFCAADSLSANEVMRLQNGNVGINTTSPSEKLHVSGNAVIGNSAYNSTYGQYLRFPFGAFDLAAGTLRAYIQFDSVEDYSVNNNDVWKWKLAAVARPGNAGNYNSQLEILRTTRNGVTDFTDFVINRNGNVGIGMINPIEKLHVSGNIQISGTSGGSLNINTNNAGNGNISFNGSTFTIVSNSSSAPLILSTSSTERMRISSAGNVGIGTSTLGRRLHAFVETGPVMRIQSSGSNASIEFIPSSVTNSLTNWVVGAQQNVGNAFEITPSTAAGGTTFSNPALLIKSNGNVGIGTTNPTQKLDIVGSYGAPDDDGGMLKIRGAGVGPTQLNFGVSADGGYGWIQTTDIAISNERNIILGPLGGNVGIGTTNPLSLLGVGAAGSTTAANGITLGGDTSANIYRLGAGVLKTDGAFQTSAYFYAGTYVQIANGNIYPGSYTTDLVLNIGNNAGAAWDTYPVTIRKGTYVGIGTNVPTGKLHVVSSVAGETVFRADGTNGTLLSVVDDLSDSLFSVNNGAGLPVLEVFADDRIVAGQYGSGDFVLTNNKIGIGTTNPINKLSVIGAASIGSATYNTAAPANGLIVQGNVGVGTTNPSSLLHVYNSDSRYLTFSSAGLTLQRNVLSTNAASPQLTIINTQGSDAGLNRGVGIQLDLGYGGSTTVVGTAARGARIAVLNETNYDATAANQNAYLAFYTATAGSLTEKVRIQSDGNVGIGATTPTAKLEVYSTAVTIANLGSNQTSQLVYIGNSSATQYSDLILRANDGQAEFFRGGNGYASWGGASALNIYNSNGPIAFHANNTANSMFLTNAGYLGIGVTVPAEKLDVRGGLIRSNARINNAEGYPVGHYTPGETVFEIDPTWSQLELQKYFNSTAFTWVAVADAPGGYCIYVDGPVNVGGFADSGFPYIPVDTNDIFYMECWIQNVGTAQGHYMGSDEYDHNFTSLGGNPGTYGYWVMSNYNPTTTWTKVSGYITGFSNTIGQFKAGTKYWTPQALFNYTAGTGTRACRISGWKVIKVSHVGDRSFTGNVNVASDLYVADELGVGVAIASKRFTYGAQISVASASIQLVLGRTASAVGQGAIGADASNTFAVWNVSGGATRQFNISQQGDVGVGNVTPTSRVTVGSNFASLKGISVSTDGFGTAQFVARKDASKCAYGILAWESQTYLSAGIYYDGSTWIHHNANNNNQMQVFEPGNGTYWYASNNGVGSWNVASAVPLWDDGARWKSSVRATRLEDSYITGGNFALGTDSPSSRLTVLGPALTAATKNTYAAAVGNLNNVDLTFGADNSYAYIQSWGSKPLYINNQGNNVLVNSNVGIGTLSPSGRLHVNTASYNSSNRPFIVNNGVQTANAKLYDTAVIQQDDVTTLRIVERNAAAANQILSFSIGDGFARIACTAQPMQFFVNGGDALGDYGYLGLNGTKAIDISTSANVGIGNVTPSAARLHIKGDGSNPVLRVETALLQGAAGGTAGKTFVGWMPIQTGALSPGDTVYIPLYK